MVKLRSVAFQFPPLRVMAVAVKLLEVGRALSHEQVFINPLVPDILAGWANVYAFVCSLRVSGDVLQFQLFDLSGTTTFMVS